MERCIGCGRTDSHPLGQPLTLVTAYPRPNLSVIVLACTFCRDRASMWERERMDRQAYKETHPYVRR